MIEEQYLQDIEKKITSWDFISSQPLSEQFIKKYWDKLHHGYIAEIQNLSENFIEEHCKDNIAVLMYQKLSESFIEKYLDELDLHVVSMFQSLSEQFIEKHLDKLARKRIAKYQYLSPEFRQKHNLPLPKNSWMYWTREEKEKYIRENTEYEIKNGKVIAYKSCRKDGYSCYSFRYHYEIGKEYSSHCDCNADEDASFGLSACFKDKALWYSSAKLFLVEIDLDDLGCITSFGKIRCRKLRILEEIKG